MARPAQIKAQRSFTRQTSGSRAGDIVGAHAAQLIGKIQPVLFLGEIRRAATAADDDTPRLFFFEEQTLPTDTRLLQGLLSCRE